MNKRILGSSLILASVLAQPTLVSAQVDPPTADTRAERDDNSSDWGWLGLLGLVGLLGLRGRDRIERTDVRVHPRTTP
jgi:MYXO-CTERM domain-containing protein